MLVIYSGILLIFLLFTILNSFFMPKLKPAALKEIPSVSIMIPLRNEERNAEELVHMLKKLVYPDLSFYLLDDQSEDATRSLLEHHIGKDVRFTLLSGKKLPEGWAGKVHACHTLSLNARQEFLLFMDADVRLHPEAVDNAVAMLQEKGGALLTGFPRFPVKYLMEKWLVPMQHFLVYFHLPLFLANYTVFPPATAAHGAFMLFRREDYLEAGGHESIKASIVDDVHLAKRMKDTGKKVLLANVTDFVTCYMYTSSKEAWNGFKKNIFPGFGRSLPVTLALCLFYACFYVLPGALFIYGIVHFFAGQSFSLFMFFPYLIIVVQKMYIDKCSNQSLLLSFSMPFSGAAFIVLMLVSMYTSLRNKGYEWKGRTYS
ncbi:glycosyltransferase [Metabacillus sp. 113a]|uniref:glycosyltransferase n=1 Tax=Metabacillus sp. 113a TaxID=3404706 RepID=UPI003CFA805D